MDDDNYMMKFTIDQAKLVEERDAALARAETAETAAAKLTESLRSTEAALDRMFQRAQAAEAELGNVKSYAKECDKVIFDLESDVIALEAKLASRGDAATQAFDEIAKACGCPEWDYPAQLVRDVVAVVRNRDELWAKCTELRETLRRECDTWSLGGESLRARAEAAEACEAAALDRIRSSAHSLWKLPPADRTRDTDAVCRELLYFEPSKASRALLEELRALRARVAELEARPGPVEVASRMAAAEDKTLGTGGVLLALLAGQPEAPPAATVPSICGFKFMISTEGGGDADDYVCQLPPGHGGRHQDGNATSQKQEG